MNVPTEFEQEIHMLMQELDAKRDRLTERLERAKRDLEQAQEKRNALQKTLDIYRQQQERPDGEEIILGF